MVSRPPCVLCVLPVGKASSTHSAVTFDAQRALATGSGYCCRCVTDCSACLVQHFDGLVSQGCAADVRKHCGVCAHGVRSLTVHVLCVMIRCSVQGSRLRAVSRALQSAEVSFPLWAGPVRFNSSKTSAMEVGFRLSVGAGAVATVQPPTEEAAKFNEEVFVVCCFCNGCRVLFYDLFVCCYDY